MMKLCRDCKHVMPDPFLDAQADHRWHRICKRGNNQDCGVMRVDDVVNGTDSCGPEGRWWEQRE